jgi:hypothetical protein
VNNRCQRHAARQSQTAKREPPRIIADGSKHFVVWKSAGERVGVTIKKYGAAAKVLPRLRWIVRKEGNVRILPLRGIPNGNRVPACAQDQQIFLGRQFSRPFLIKNKTATPWHNAPEAQCQYAVRIFPRIILPGCTCATPLF